MIFTNLIKFKTKKNKKFVLLLSKFILGSLVYETEVFGFSKIGILPVINNTFNKYFENKKQIYCVNSSIKKFTNCKYGK